MGSQLSDMSPRQAGRLAGFAYLGLFVLGIFANFFVREGLIEVGDAAATAANISESQALFRWGLVAFLIIFILDVAVAWLLYILFRTISGSISLVAAWFRLVYTVLLGVALVFFFLALKLLSGPDYLTVFNSGELNAQGLLFLDAFNDAWLIGLTAFGIHLIILGYLMLKSDYMPKIIGGLIAVAGSAYIVDTVANSLLSNYAEYETVFLIIVAVPAVIAELAFTIWLLLKAGRE